MSVTFALARYVEDSHYGTVLALGADHTHTRPASCCEDAALYHGCCDHAEAEEEACGCRAFEVNLSNANAAAALERLGFDFDPQAPAGEATAEEFAGRVLTANVGRDDSGWATTVDGGPGTGTAMMVDCGRGAGYFDRTMARLADLAAEAARLDLMVGWA